MAEVRFCSSLHYVQNLNSGAFYADLLLKIKVKCARITNNENKILFHLKTILIKRMRFLNINIQDINTNYTVKGEGKDILLLHGWGAKLDFFGNIIENLAKSNKVYAIDLPGFGGTQEPKEAWNVDKYVDFVIEFIEKMNISELSLLGHSFGGRVIIKLVNRKNLKFKVDKIVLIDSAGIKPQNQKKKSLKTRIYKMLKIFVANKIVLRIFPNALNNLKKKFGSADYRNATPIMRDTLVKTVNEDLTELLPNITQSTLLIWGDKDTATPIEDAKKMESLIKDSGLVTLKGAGHFSFVEQPILVNKVLTSFFSAEE